MLLVELLRSLEKESTRTGEKVLVLFSLLVGVNGSYLTTPPNSTIDRFTKTNAEGSCVSPEFPPYKIRATCIGKLRPSRNSLRPLRGFSGQRAGNRSCTPAARPGRTVSVSKQDWYKEQEGPYRALTQCC